METNIKPVFDGENNEIPKKVWSKPECEIIGKDMIKGGSVTYLSEGQSSPTLGFSGVLS